MKNFATFFLVLLSVAAAPAQAQSAITFGLRPETQSKGYFVFTAKPGETIRDAVLAVNDSDQSLGLIVSLADGLSAATGGASFGDKADKAKQWISAPDLGVITLPPRKGEVAGAVRLPFTLTVPADAKPGDYLFGFIAEPTAGATPATTAKGFVINVIPRAAVSIVVSVAGAAEKKIAVELLTVSSPKEQWHLQVSIRNTGNVMWRGNGKVTLQGNGAEIARDFAIGTVFPGDRIAYPIYMDAPVSGQYSATVRLSDERGAAADYQTSLTVGGAGLIFPTPAPESVLAATQQAVSQATRIAGARTHLNSTPALRQPDADAALPSVAQDSSPAGFDGNVFLWLGGIIASVLFCVLFAVLYRFIK
jgi:hypothetical protein